MRIRYTRDTLFIARLTIAEVLLSVSGLLRAKLSIYLSFFFGNRVSRTLGEIPSHFAGLLCSAGFVIYYLSMEIARTRAVELIDACETQYDGVIAEE